MVFSFHLISCRAAIPILYLLSVSFKFLSAPTLLRLRTFHVASLKSFFLIRFRVVIVKAIRFSLVVDMFVTMVFYSAEELALRETREGLPLTAIWTAAFSVWVWSHSPYGSLHFLLDSRFLLVILRREGLAHLFTQPLVCYWTVSSAWLNIDRFCVSSAGAILFRSSPPPRLKTFRWGPPLSAIRGRA